MIAVKRYIHEQLLWYLIFQILTDKRLHVLDVKQQNVYALGDCADIDGNPLPCTAQV